MTVLALTHRPQSFSDVVGQQHILPILRALVVSGDVPPALEFSGTRGTGKTTTARIFAAALNCLNSENGDACGTCASCVAVQAGHSDSVLEIDAASSGGVADVRSIKEGCLYSHSGTWRVVIFDEAHSMSREAYNTLLKVLEEPPANTVFLLVTTEPEKILGTVRSRSMPFEFRRIKSAEIAARLKKVSDAENIGAEESLIEAVTEMAQGGLRDALMILDQMRRVGVTTGADFREFYGIQDYSVPLMWSAIRGDYAEGYRLVAEHFSRTGEASGMVSDLSRLVAELLVLKSSGRPAERVGEALEERSDMAKATTAEALVEVCEVLWELRRRTRATENDQRSVMETAFALISSALRPESQQPILQEKSTSSDPLSLEELREFARD